MQVEAPTKTVYPAEKIVNKYIEDVLSGKIPTCEYVKLTINRHLRDLENGHERGLYFDPEAAQVEIDFTSLLKHSKGQWAGRHFVLEPWQMFINWCVFGWKNIDGTRRFRTVYDEEARKNGKSTRIASIGLFGLGFDNEAGSEIYSVATKEDQARITLKEGQSMTRKSGYLGGIAKVHKRSISIDEADSTWQALGRDSKTQDGLSPHMVLVDEFHAHPDRRMLDVMDSAVGSRTQPLLFIITTAGFNIHSVCYKEREYAIKVLNGLVDDTYFAIIFTLDEGDDWKDESVWIKANPNLGVTVSIKDMRRMRDKAIESPGTQNNFLTKKLNVWTTQEVKFFNMGKWDRCKDVVPESDLVGQPCFIGVDLNSKIDIGAIIAAFPLDDDRVVWIPRFYCPREGAEIRSRTDRVEYLVWAEQGYLTLTPGDRTDYEFIKADIEKMWSMFDVQKMGFDQWNFEYLYQKLIADGMDSSKVIEYGQTLKNLSEPTKEVEALVLSEKLVHNNHPILQWMAGNTAVYTDPNENIRPVKNKSSEKIDGIVAGIMAMGMMMVPDDSVDKDANLREVGI